MAPQGVPGHEFEALCRTVFGTVELLGLFHARKLRVHELALRLRLGPGPHGGCGSPSRSTTASRRRSPRATSCCGRRPPGPRAGLPRRLPRVSRATARWPPRRDHLAAPGIRRELGARPALPHALRRGSGDAEFARPRVRDLAVRGGVAVGGDRHQLSPVARRARRHPGAAHPVPDPGPVPTSSRRRCDRPLPGVPGRRPARVPPADTAGFCRRRGGGGRRARALGGRVRARRATGCRAAARAGGLLGALGATRSGPRRRPTPCCRCWPPTRGSSAASDRDRVAPAALRRWEGGLWLPECAHATGLIRCSRRRGCGPRASS